MKLRLSNHSVVLRPSPAGTHWNLVEPLEYNVLGLEIRVPAGLSTDLASVPRPLWAIIPPFGHYTAAAVIHDYLYQIQHVNDVPIDRSTADLVFLRGMEDLFVRKSRRLAMYWGVRSFGWAPWNQRRKEAGLR